MSSISQYFSQGWRQLYPSSSLPSNINLDDNAFPAYLEIDISQDHFIAPTIIVPNIAEAKRLGYTKIIFSLVHGQYQSIRTFHKKTVSSILNTFLNTIINNMRLAHVCTSKNIDYYGSNGLILNNNYDILFLPTVEVSIQNTIVYIDNPKCHLSYKVFENSSELIEKTIIKQAIPYYSREYITLDISNTSKIRSNTFFKIKTEIADLSNMIIKPTAPKIQESDKSLVNTLIQHT